MVLNAMRELGVLVGTTGREGNVLKIRPPLVITRQEAEVLVGTLDQRPRGVHAASVARPRSRIVQGYGLVLGVEGDGVHSNAVLTEASGTLLGLGANDDSSDWDSIGIAAAAARSGRASPRR